MMKYINFFIFWMLMTWAIGDPIGMGLVLVGFIMMHFFIEDQFSETTQI